MSSDTRTEPRTPLPLDRWGIGAHISSLWFLLALITLVSWQIIDGSALHASQLPVQQRMPMLALELVLLACSVLLLGAPFSLLGWITRSRFAHEPSWRGLSNLALSLAFCVPMGFYLASWAGFASTGRFLDREGLRFIATNPVQFFQHAAHLDPIAFIAIPFLIAALSFAWAWATPPLLVRLQRRAQIGLTSASIGLFAVLAVVAFAGERPDAAKMDNLVIDPDVGMVYTDGDLYRSNRDDRSGPITRIVADWRAPEVGEVRDLAIDEAIAIQRDPIISMEEYVAGVESQSIEHWNVIVAVVESLRTDQLAILGGPRVVMPHLEAIAAEGRRYPDHYTQASHSNYADLCPLSSHYPLRSASTHVYPENPTYPRVLIYDILDALGWHTAIISSQNETWGGMIHYLDTGSLDHFFHSETFDGETYIPRHDKGFEQYVKGSKRSGKIDDRFTIDEAIRWTSNLPDDSPFFLYLNLQNSHLPYETPADFERPFGPDQIRFQIRFVGYPRNKVGVVKDLYADSLAYSDHQLNRLIASLKARGEWERTLLVVTGDTGQAFYEHGGVAHAGPIFNEVMKVPLVIRAPGLEPAEDRRPAQHIDVPPSILDLLGLPPHPSFQGESLIASDPHPHRARYLVSQTPDAHQYGIVRDGFKLIYAARLDKMILFDLEKDPGERVNAAEQHPEIVAELRLRLDTWRKNQVEYYRALSQHARTYPPKLED